MSALVPRMICHTVAPAPPAAVRRGAAGPLWAIVAAIFSGLAVADPISAVARLPCPDCRPVTAAILLPPIK